MGDATWRLPRSEEGGKWEEKRGEGKTLGRAVEDDMECDRRETEE